MENQLILDNGYGEWSYSKRKDGTWTARKQFGFNATGKRAIKAFYGKTKSEVKEKAKQYDILFHDGDAFLSKTTFGSYFVTWMKLYKYNKVKASTYDAIEFCYENRIKPYAILSQAQMHQLTANVLQEYINQLAASNKYSIATIRKTYNTINNCFKKAIMIGDIKSNPLLAVELPHQDMLSVPTKTIEFFEDDDIRKIIDESLRKRGGKDYKTAKYYQSQNSDYYKYGHHIVFLLQTGLRVGEALSLQWKDINLTEKLVCVSGSLSLVYDRNKLGERTSLVTKDGSTKTEQGNRIVPLSNIAVAALKEIERQCVEHVDDDYVFVSRTNRNASSRNIRRTLNLMQKNAATKIQNSGPHVLRHTFASMLIRRGVDVKVVSELLGHKKVSTTYDIYVSLIKAQKVSAIQLLNIMNENS